MIQKECIGDSVLYCAKSIDVFQEIDDISFDCFVTDPPYGLGERSGAISKLRSHKNQYKADFIDSEDYVIKEIIPIINNIILRSKSNRGALTPGSKCSWFYPKPEVLGGFLHPATTGMCSWGRTTYQPILFYGKDPMSGLTIQNITRSVTEKAMTKEHPCAKPLNAWTWLVDRVSKEYETVIDPFMGAGTTGVACVNLNRKFIGIEMSNEYFDLSCKMIENAYKQPTLFDKKVSTAKMKKIFKEKQKSLF